MLLTVFVLQIAIPVGLLQWLWRRRPRRRAGWLLDVAFVGSMLAAFSVALPWTIVPRVVRDAYLIAFAAAAVRARRRTGPSEPARGRGWRVTAATLRALIAVLMAGLAAAAIAGMRVPAGPAIDLVCPFAPGTFLVVNGGASALLNHHLGTLASDPRFAPWRGQSYGIDMVRVDDWGLRARGLLPREPARYHIYGQPVVAPCSGRVVSTANDRPDMPPPTPDPDRTKLAGNHVLLDCGGIEVLLAHLKPGTVRVSVGETVATGSALGLIGNSGNTSEPHLHLSAQRRQTGDALVGGEPVWVTIGTDFLVRNERLLCR